MARARHRNDALYLVAVAAVISTEGGWAQTLNVDAAVSGSGGILVSPTGSTFTVPGVTLIPMGTATLSIDAGTCGGKIIGSVHCACLKMNVAPRGFTNDSELSFSVSNLPGPSCEVSVVPDYSSLTSGFEAGPTGATTVSFTGRRKWKWSWGTASRMYNVKVQIYYEVPDTDGETLPDGFETLAGTNPNVADSDADGVTDDLEDSDGDGLTNEEEWERGTNPGNADSDGDGTKDGQEVEDGTDPLDPQQHARAEPAGGAELAYLDRLEGSITQLVDLVPLGLLVLLVAGIAAYAYRRLARKGRQPTPSLPI